MKKIKLVIGIASMAMVINAAHAVGFTDPFNGPTVDPAWGVDRRLPTTVDIQTVGGNDRLHLGVTPAGHDANSFYDYQGIQRTTSVTGDWVAKGQIDITSDLTGGLANLGLWIRTGNGGDESTADYDILAFRNPDGSSPGFYSWDDVNSVWLPTSASASLGWHDFEMDYSAVGSGSVTYLIDGTVVRTDTALANPLYADTVTTAFAEIYNYGDRSYSGYLDNISVGLRAVPDTASTASLLGFGVFGLGFLRRKVTTT